MRDDIQGLRGIAIIFVVLFHVWPSNFANGYIGVDIFFVLSGYLMSVLFSRETKLTVKVIGIFYYRRLKRIFPLYFIIIPVILITSQFILGQVWLLLNNRHVIYALLLVKNMETIWDDSDYFSAFKSADPSKDVYLHTWSLAVEVQFYFFVPAIFLILEKLRKKSYKIIFLTLIAVTTFVNYTVTPPTFAFNYTLSRIWQFALGMIAHHFHDETEELITADLGQRKTYTKIRALSSLVLLVTLLFVLLPVEIDAAFLRPIVTLVAAASMWINGGVTKANVLCSRPLTYIGDISYSLYLIHWPVIVFIGTSTSQQIQTVLIVSSLLSILLYHCYENIYRSFSKRKIGVLLSLLLVINASSVLLVKTCPRFQRLLVDMDLAKANNSVQEAIEKNMEFSQTYVSNILKCNFVDDPGNPPELTRPWGLCEYPVCPFKTLEEEFQKGNGSKIVVVVGNSYAMNQANTIQEEFQGNYSNFYVISSISLQVICDEFVANPHPFFHNQWEIVMKMVTSLKPDYIFVITRFQESQKAPFTTAVKDDPIVVEYNDKVSKLEEISQRVFIEGAHPMYPLLHLNNYIEALKKGVPLLPFQVVKTDGDAEMMWSRARIAAITCQKCEIIDTSVPFQEGNYYLSYDPETLLSFVDNDIHLTEAGMERLRPLYRNVISRL